MANAKKDDKRTQLEAHYTDEKGKSMTTNEGVRVAHDTETLKAGQRGPSLLQDFHHQEKMQHFDRERIPERVVHARGVGAHGTFTVTNDMSAYTSADFLRGEGKETPVFLRFSTVQGSKGSADTVRDPHGFAVKFYTQEGNFDIPGLTHAVFFIQDAIKFPDLIHSVKPEPKTEIPQGQSAHTNFWDFVANNPETIHNVFWQMSDRAIPRSMRMVEGFGIHTYRLVNDEGVAHFIRFHFKPELGAHSLIWDEAQKLQGRDPDFHRRDLIEAIEKGDYPRWTFGAQIIEEDQEFMFDFDILDPTKLWPEEIVPVTEFGVLELNRNVKNFFAETEQAAFHPGNFVPGIEPSNDPLLQGRIFSYTDTQMHRLGGPNFQHLPINRPLVDVANNQRDGQHQMKIHTSETNYSHNSLSDNDPKADGGFKELRQAVSGFKTRSKPAKFLDFYTQARLYFHSLSDWEREHTLAGFKFELTKVTKPEVRQQVVNLLMRVDEEAAKDVGAYLGLTPEDAKNPHEDDTTGADPGEELKYEGKSVDKSPALSLANQPKKPETLKVGVLIREGFDEKEVAPVLDAMEAAGMYVNIISDKLGTLTVGKKEHEIKETFISTDTVLYDAIYVAGLEGLDPKFKGEIRQFVEDAYKYYKPLIVASDSESYLDEGRRGEPGVLMLMEDGADKVVDLVTEMRYWERDLTK
ncbi:catalase [Peptoniphilus ivorii]|uniref:catalase n=1 Tax=Aedoeadaptatus ivorii TaxID=54006 RepID=UPI0027849CED|nr:catalase [Peptoniphilus ivorii]MDQ0508769.1 catalase [Peptoniphilus ivorii]